MIKNNIIFLFILMFSGVSFAELSCSANGTQIYYINGVHVEADNTADARNIDVLIRSSPYNPNEIDKSSNLPTVLGVYNYSTGFFDDFTKLRRQLLLDDGDMTSEKRRKHFDELIKKEFNFLVASVWSSRSTEYKEKAGASLKKTLDYIYNAGDKNSITNYDRAFTENKLYEELKLLDSQLADLVAIAAVDRQVVIKVKKVISDSVFTDNKKVIFVAHSQGNEALRTSYLELQNDLVGQKDKLDKLDKVFGTLHVASPSPVYIFPLPRSQGIKLDVDLVIKDSTLFTTDNTPLAINYYLETEGANASLFRRVPLIGNILGTIGEFITALLTFNPDAFLHHSFTATYLNDKIYARSVASDPSTSDSMPTIFHKNIVKVAEALGDNCDYPSLDFSVENTTKDPKGFTFTLPSYAPSILASVKDLADPDLSTKYEWSIASSSLISSGNTFEIKLTSQGSFTATVKATNKYNKTSTVSIVINVPGLQPIITRTGYFCAASTANNIGVVPGLSPDAPGIYFTGYILSIETDWEYRYTPVIKSHTSTDVGIDKVYTIGIGLPDNPKIFYDVDITGKCPVGQPSPPDQMSY